MEAVHSFQDSETGGAEDVYSATRFLPLAGNIAGPRSSPPGWRSMQAFRNQDLGGPGVETEGSGSTAHDGAGAGDVSVEDSARPLPPGWEMRRVHGRAVFINSSTRETTWDDPRDASASPAASSIPAPVSPPPIDEEAATKPPAFGILLKTASSRALFYKELEQEKQKLFLDTNGARDKARKARVQAKKRYAKQRRRRESRIQELEKKENEQKKIERRGSRNDASAARGEAETRVRASKGQKKKKAKIVRMVTESEKKAVVRIERRGSSIDASAARVEAEKRLRASKEKMKKAKIARMVTESEKKAVARGKSVDTEAARAQAKKRINRLKAQRTKEAVADEEHEAARLAREADQHLIAERAHQAAARRTKQRKKKERARRRKEEEEQQRARAQAAEASEQAARSARKMAVQRLRKKDADVRQEVQADRTKRELEKMQSVVEAEHGRQQARARLQGNRFMGYGRVTALPTVKVPENRRPRRGKSFPGGGVSEMRQIRRSSGDSNSSRFHDDPIVPVSFEKNMKSGSLGKEGTRRRRQAPHIKRRRRSTTHVRRLPSMDGHVMATNEISGGDPAHAWDASPRTFLFESDMPRIPSGHGRAQARERTKRKKSRRSSSSSSRSERWRALGRKATAAVRMMLQGASTVGGRAKQYEVN